MKIITCASYYGTGSSALTDLVSEYHTVHPNDEFEFRFVHDPDGISTLEYHLVDHPNREVSGYALKRFVEYSRFNAGTWFNKKYEKFFHGHYREITQKYIDKLTDLKFKGFWQFDLSSKGMFKYYFLGIFNKFFIKIKAKNASILPKEITYIPNLSKENFLNATQEYMSELFTCLNNDKKPYLVLDQLVPSSNLEQCLKYFKEDLYTIVIDRDPRDVYVLCRTSWRYDHLFPHDSVESWCKWFKYNRVVAGEKCKNSNVLYLNFEDFIFNYDNTVSKIEKLTGLNKEDHNKQFTRMNPKRSVVNTRIWLRDKRWEDDIKVIEKMLPEFLYDFSKADENNVVGVEVKDKGTF